MKSQFIKGLATSLAVVMTATSVVLPVFAAEKVTVAHNDDGTITATRTDGATERIALAQFDNYGRLQGLNISSASSPATVTNGFNFDPNYTTKVISFSDFETATALEDARILGSKTLFIWDGETRTDVFLDSNGGSYGIDKDFSDGVGFGEYTDANGNKGFRALSDGTFTKSQRHIHLYPESITSDWLVYSFDMTMNSDVASSSYYNQQFLSVVLYGGVTEKTPLEQANSSSSTGAYNLLNLYATRDKEWYELTYDYFTQYRVPRGGTNNGRINVDNTYNVAGTVSAGQTLNVQVEVNQRDRYAKVYVNGTLQTSLDLSDSAEGTDNPFEIRALRFRFPGGGRYDITLDNMYVYEGSERRTDNISTEKIREIILTNSSYLDKNGKYTNTYNDSIYTAQIGANKAVHANTGVVWDGTKKVILEHTPYENNGVQMVPVADLEAALGMNCQSTANAVEKDNVQYVPIEDFLGTTAYTRLDDVTHNPNCYVIGDTSISTDDDAFNRWMLFYRPTAETVLADYNASDLAGEHPRILATQDDFDRMRAWYEDYIEYDADFNARQDSNQEYDEDGNYIANSGTWIEVKANSPWNRWLRSGAAFVNDRVEKIMAANPDAIDANDGDIPYYASYDAVGRMSYQRLLASDAHVLSLWYNMSGDTKYAEALWKELEQVIKFPDFNLGHKLDVSEAMAAMAIAYDWMYDYWAQYPERLEALEKCMYENGLFYSWHGYQEGGMMSGEFLATANHGTVGNNGAMMLAASLIDVYDEECAYIISEALKSQEENIWKWNTGAWFEGAHYWELTMQHTAKFIGTLDMLFPGGYGFSGLEGLSETGIAEIQHHSPLGIYNYGDGGMNSYWVPELIWLANEYDQEDLAYFVWKNQKAGFSGNKLWKGEDTALALLWLDDETVARTLTWQNSYSPSVLGLDYCNDEIDVALMRDTHDSTTDYTFVGIKGGCATDTHAQIDAGSFVYENDGVRWAQDMGMGSYLAGYFDSTSGGQRWKQLPARGEAHNTIIVNPDRTSSTVAYEDQNINGRAEIKWVKDTTSGAIATINMKPVLFDVSSATRGFFFTDNRQSLVIRDEITPSAAATMYWTMAVPSGTTYVANDDGSYTLTNGDKSIKFEYVVSGQNSASITWDDTGFKPISAKDIFDYIGGEDESGNPVYSHKQIKIQIPVTASAGANVTITVKLTPTDVTNATAISAYTSGISSWSL